MTPQTSLAGAGGQYPEPCASPRHRPSKPGCCSPGLGWCFACVLLTGQGDPRRPPEPSPLSGSLTCQLLSLPGPAARPAPCRQSGRPPLGPPPRTQPGDVRQQAARSQGFPVSPAQQSALRCLLSSSNLFPMFCSLPPRGREDFGTCYSVSVV